MDWEKPKNNPSSQMCLEVLFYRLVYIRVYKTESKSMGERISWGKY